MRILIIDEEFPYPLNNGKRTRSFSLTRCLARNHQVTYLAYGDPDGEAAAALEAVGVSCHGVTEPDRRQSGPRFYLRLLANLFSPLPYIVTSHTTARFARRLAELVASERIDMVICEWTPYAIFLKDVPRVCSVIVAHNIEAAIWRRYEANESNPARRWYIQVQRRKVEAFERACFQWSSGATAVSQAEAREIEGYGTPYPVAVIDNGVDVEFFHPLPTAPGSRNIVFSGALDWRPNQDAVEFFVAEIFPLIRQSIPDVTFTVVGRNPPRRIRDLAKTSGVAVTGTVEDVRPYMAEAAVSVVPLRIGGGSRLKILASFAMAKAVVSTTIGAEGLDVADGKDIVLADQPADFATAVVNCLRDEALRDRIAAAGRRLVEDHYQWEQLGAKLERYLQETLERA